MDNADQGTMEITIVNAVTGKEAKLSAPATWTLEQVRQAAYAQTNDTPRPGDSFVGERTGKALTATTLNMSLKAAVAADGELAQERRFHIRASGAFSADALKRAGTGMPM